jgi:hypothetical protein
MSGTAVGLASLAGNSRFMLDGWVDETALLNLGLRTSLGRVSNVYFAGAAPFTRPMHFAAGTGIGVTVPFKELTGMAEATAAALFEPESYRRNGTMARVRLMAGWRAAPGVLVYAGPVWTLLAHYEWSDFPDPALAIPLFSHADWNGTVRSWLGFSYGIRLFGE